METQSKTAGVQLKQTFISLRESQWTHRSLTVTSARFLHLQAREENCIHVKQNCRPDRSGLGLFGVFPLVKLRLWTVGFRFSFRRRVLIRELSVEFSSDGFYEANICSVSKTWFSDQLQTEPGVHCLQEQSPLHPLCYILFATSSLLHPFHSTLSTPPSPKSQHCPFIQFSAQCWSDSLKRWCWPPQTLMEAFPVFAPSRH